MIKAEEQFMQDDIPFIWVVKHIEGEDVHYLRIAYTSFCGMGNSYFQALKDLINTGKEFEDDEYMNEFPESKKAVEYLSQYRVN